MYRYVTKFIILLGLWTCPIAKAQLLLPFRPAHFCEEVLAGIEGHEAFNNETVVKHAVYFVNRMINPDTTKETLASPQAAEALTPSRRGLTKVYDELLAKAMNDRLDRELKAIDRFTPALVTGARVPEVIIGIHSFGLIEKTVLPYVDAHLKHIPWVQLYSNGLYGSSVRQVVENANVLRFSTSGELRDLNINADRVHMYGGSLGSCLTRGIIDTADMILNHNRQQATIIVHTEISYSYSTSRNLIEELKNEPDPLKYYENSLSAMHFAGLGTPKYRVVRKFISQSDGSSKYVIEMKRVSDNKAIFVEFSD